MEQERSRLRISRLLSVALCLSLIVNGLLCAIVQRDEHQIDTDTAQLKQATAMVNSVTKFADACHARRKSI